MLATTRRLERARRGAERARRPGLRSTAAGGMALALFSALALAPVWSASAGWVGVESFQGPASQRYMSPQGPAVAIHLGVSTAEDSTPPKIAPLYTLSQLLFSGVINWGGYKFTFYSQQVLPGGGLAIPGRHVNEDGYVSDGDGFIVLAGSAPKGTVYETPFGYQGKIYDRGTVGNHLDVYIR